MTGNTAVDLALGVAAILALTGFIRWILAQRAILNPNEGISGVRDQILRDTRLTTASVLLMVPMMGPPRGKVLHPSVQNVLRAYELAMALTTYGKHVVMVVSTGHTRGPDNESEAEEALRLAGMDHMTEVVVIKELESVSTWGNMMRTRWAIDHNSGLLGCQVYVVSSATGHAQRAFITGLGRNYRMRGIVPADQLTQDGIYPTKRGYEFLTMVPTVLGLGIFLDLIIKFEIAVRGSRSQGYVE